MNVLKKHILLVALLTTLSGHRVVASQVGNSWLTGAMDTATSLGEKALPALGTIGAIAASTVIPYGLGPIATVAAPYLIAAGANYITKKVSGVDIAEVKYREDLKEEVKQLTETMRRNDKRYLRTMKKMRKLHKARRLRKMKHLEDEENETEEDDFNFII